MRKKNKFRSSNGLSHTNDKAIELWVKNLPLLKKKNHEYRSAHKKLHKKKKVNKK